MFENLSDRLQAVFGKLTGKGKLSEADVDAAMREIRMALLEADVNFKVVKDFVAQVRERAVGADVMKSLTPGQMVVKIVLDELTDAHGRHRVAARALRAHPQRHHARRPAGLGQDDRHRQARQPAAQAGAARPLLVACDVYRPAAIDQLEALGRELDIPVYRGEGDRRRSRSPRPA